MKQHYSTYLFYVILCSSFFSSCSFDAWKAKRELEKQGVTSFNVDSLNASLELNQTKNASLMIRANVLRKASAKEKSLALLNATKHSQDGVLHAMIQKKIKFHEDTKVTAIRIATRSNQLGTLNALLSGGFPKRVKMKNGQSLVAWSVQNDRYAMVRLFLAHNCSPHAEEDEVKALEVALTERAPSWLVEQLTQARADTNFLTTENLPFLHEVILNHPIETLIPVLQARTDLAILDEEGKTALFKAISTGSLDKVQALIKYGAPPQHIDEEERSYLHLAQIFGDNSEITQYFIDLGIDLHAKSASDRNALDLALDYGRERAAEVLIRNGGGTSKITFHRLYKEDKEMSLSLMIRAGLVDPNTSLSSGDSLLIDFIKRDKVNLVKVMLEQGADPNLTALDEEPPLSYAVALRNSAMVSDLIDAKASVNYTFHSPGSARFSDLIKTEGRIKWFISKDPGITPLMMACDQGDLAIVRLLKEAGAKNKGSKKFRFWPGNFAARQSYTDIVQYMVGARPGHRNRTVVVDLSQQRAKVYNKSGKQVMSFRVSSGKKGYTTKTGEFVVTNKKKHHVSTIYDSKMPYFQRLSYGDFGFHEGVVPNYAASHGCIRCPMVYAKKLFYYLKVGDVVTIKP